MAVLRPPTLAAALDALAADPTAVALAGGTDLMVAAHEGRTNLESVVVIGALPELRGWTVSERGDAVRIGAAVTATELTEPALADAVPALAAAARALGSVSVRNAATVGGSLGTCSPAADLVTVLAALDAVVEIRSVRECRTMEVGEFVLGPHENALAPDELVVAVVVPAVDGPQEFARVGGRAALAVALVNVAVVVHGRDRRVRAAAGAVGPTVVRSDDAERFLADAVDWDHVGWADGVHRDEVSTEFGRRLAAASDPVDDFRATATYRRHALSVLGARLARRCFG